LFIKPYLDPDIKEECKQQIPSVLSSSSVSTLISDKDKEDQEMEIANSFLN